MKKTIEELESQFEQVLKANLDPIAPGYEPEVSLYEKGRKKKRNASADNWSPESGEIRIAFRQQSPAGAVQPETPGAGLAAKHVLAAAASPVTASPDPLADLVRALYRAESRPGYDFVALKWFRDAYLPEEASAWASSPAARQTVLSEAIAQRLVLTSKVPNPKSPQFPVTAIRLNRSLAQVTAILGHPQPAEESFAPVEIRGEPLSATILRERR